MFATSSYCIITPVFNEATVLETTIRSVLEQTIQPMLWVIIDDGSTDNTAEIIQKYLPERAIIRYAYRKRPRNEHYFASNVHAIMMGYELLKQISFDYLAILDADIKLPRNYYEYILGKFASDERLGVASGIYHNLINGKPEAVLHDRRSTPKAIQVFRRELFEKIGGFLPLPYGGEDTVSCFMARMAGWKVWSFPEISALHLKPTGTGMTKSCLAVRFNQGICEYNLATHPLFFLLKAIRRAFLEKPLIFGSMARVAGYLWAATRRDKTLLPKNVVNFLRKEQLDRVFKGNRIDYWDTMPPTY